MDEDDKDEEDDEFTCTNKVYDKCMYSALENHMMSGHGCVVPFIISDKDICTDPDKANATYWIAWNRVTNQVRKYF